MTHKILLILGLVFSSVLLFAQADDKRMEEIKKMTAGEEIPDGWRKGGAFGFDLAGLGLMNPRFGSGENRFGLGGLGTFFVNLKSGKDYWDNNIDFQLAVQSLKSNKGRYQKNVDVIRFNSRYGHQIRNKLFGAIDLNVETLLLPTYPENFLRGRDGAEEKKLANLFSPVRISLSPGLDYKHNNHFSVFFAPIGVKLIYVADDDIAQLGLHGNKLKEGSETEYEKMFFQAGANLKAQYNNKFFNEKVIYSTQLDLFSNYLLNPQNIDVLWGHALDFIITKNLSLALKGEMLYDHDIMVNVDRNDNGEYEGVEAGEIGRRVSSVGSFYLKYSTLF